MNLNSDVQNNPPKIPFVSVVIPCRNEERYIADLIESIVRQDYPKEKTEVIIADGMSDDRTREIINQYAQKYQFIKMIDNPQKIVPTALNLAIKLSVGEVIIRLDAHCIYPENYFSELIKVLIETGADNVGAMWETCPGANTLAAKSIAIVMSHPFGVGNAVYRTRNNASEPFEVDTVPFGCYKRSVFDKIGFFDEELVRNQDNEFNERLIKNNGKIYLIPTLKIKYFARDNYYKLWKMFYQYGLFGPLVDKKLRKPARLRRYIPSIFVLSLLIPNLVSVFYKKINLLSVISAVMYAVCASTFSILLSIKERNFLLFPFLCVAFLVSHLSYGIGYFVGIKYSFKSDNNLYDITMSR